MKKKFLKFHTFKGGARPKGEIMMKGSLPRSNFRDAHKMKDQESLNAIEGKTIITYKTEIHKDSPCKALDIRSKDSICKD